MITIGSLFSGIEGLGLGVHRALLAHDLDADHRWLCELAPWKLPEPQDAKKRDRWLAEVRQARLRHAVLAARFPGVPVYPDVVEMAAALTTDPRYTEPVDLLIGGFPCTDISVAGKGAGLAGEKSGLWFAMLDIVRALRPKAVLAENVAVLQRRGLAVVADGLVQAGYRVRVTRIQAADVGAPHKRERLLILAERSDVQGAVFPSVSGVWTDADGTWAGVVPRWTSGEGPNGVWTTATSGDGGKAGSKKYAQGGTPLSAQVRDWNTPVARESCNERKDSARTYAGKPISSQVRDWNTPVARDGSGDGPKVLDGQRGAIVSQQVRDWPSPMMADGKAIKSNGGRGNPSTTAAVKSWPTVRKSDDKSPRASGSAASQGAPPLSAVVRTAWPSPIARDWKSHSTATKENARPLSEHVPGPLHPDWVEALMGLPIGWSNPDVPTNELHPPAGWPMGQGPDQYAWEPPRMLMKGQLLPWRTERIAALGNGVVPQCVEAALSPPLASAEPQLDDGAVDSEATAHAE